MSTEPLLPEKDGEALKRDLSVSSFKGKPTIAERLGRYATAFWLVGPLVIGTAIGWWAPVQGEPCSGLPPAIERLSTIIGWVYFAAWSISFYPQVWLNFGRKSVVGMSLDFQVLNMVGFLCYAIYNSALYWNPTVRQEYALEHGGAMPAVHANDVFFAIHAAALTAVTLFQCFIHDRGGQVPSRLSLIAAGTVVVAATAYGTVVAIVGECVSGDCDQKWWWKYLSLLSWLYFLSFVKLGISLVKYIPQVVLNYKRKSTIGWNIWNVLLDFEGGTLSLAQLLMDSGVTKDWSPVTGNPVKFGLGFTSMFFDVIFMTQHYVLYRQPKDAAAPQLAAPAYPTEGGCGDCGQVTCSCIQHLAHLAEEGQQQESPHRSRGSPRWQQQQQQDAFADGWAPVDLEAGHGASEGCSHCLHHHSREQQPEQAQQGAVADVREVSVEEGTVEGDVERAALLGRQGAGSS